MSIWLGPVWDDYYKTANSLINKANANFKAQNINTVLKLTVKDLATQEATMAALAPKLLVRVGILNGLLAVGALAELAYSAKDILNVSNGMDRLGQVVKNISLAISGGIGLISSGNRFWQCFLIVHGLYFLLQHLYYSGQVLPTY